jgi:tryptophan synthase alpha chain
MSAAEELQHAIENPKRGATAVMPYLTAGFPVRDHFSELLSEVSVHADAIELGVPFTDPMADGVTIQEASRAALEQEVNLRWILRMLGDTKRSCPVVLMSYLNPLLCYGLRRLVQEASDVGVHGFIVPDLPFEESEGLGGLCEEHGLALVQLVTPLTPPERLRRLCRASSGFVYAVTMTGTTGASAGVGDIEGYLARVSAAGDLPICAGFGIRNAADIEALRGQADGAIVGSALIRALQEGESGPAFVAGLVDGD